MKSFEVDAAFFQDAEHRPPKRSSISDAGGSISNSIPLIDFSPLAAADSTTAEHSQRPLAGLLHQIECASRDWGFFQVVNHGVPSGLLRRLLSASKAFYDLPIEDKRKVKRDEENPSGYHDTEHTKNVRDWKEVFDFLLHDSIPAMPSNLQNQWPTSPPDLREVCEEYAREVEKLAFKLLELISLTLGLPQKRLHAYFEGQLSFLRLNHYPPCPVPHLALGVGRHKDSGALTVLLQDDVGGLEVKRKSDGKWIRLNPTPNALIINVGDVVQVWSNGKYESAEHRVTVNSEREMFSVPFFFNPGYHVMVKPLQELTSDKEPARYEPYSFGEFFDRRNISNFKKLDIENVQIDHFKK